MDSYPLCLITGVRDMCFLFIRVYGIKSDICCGPLSKDKLRSFGLKGLTVTDEQVDDLHKADGLDLT